MNRTWLFPSSFSSSSCDADDADDLKTDKNDTLTLLDPCDGMSFSSNSHPAFKVCLFFFLLYFLSLPT